MGRSCRHLVSATYAHSINSRGQRHRLVDHLQATADLAARFAEPFGGAELARAAGLLHDVGKASPEFQEYLHRCERGEPTTVKVDHKGAGAVLAMQRGLQFAPPLVHGHHGGLRDLQATISWLREQEASDAVRSQLDGLPDDLESLLRSLPTSIPPMNDPLRSELLLRMVFSALVDADFLDTEAHFRPERGEHRRSPLPTLESLHARLQANQGELESRHSQGGVNAVRREIRQICEASAAQPAGLFRLAVPTGGGKTRGGMAFALAHALCQGLCRVIVAVPFISITEQTASVYRGIFGEEAVLEHHSGLDDEHLHSDSPTTRLWARLSAENWDAPIIVTTAVQLLESLFGSATSRTRKLHSVARSVIILDEAQALPPTLMRPIVEMLRRLCRDYGCTVVLSTATQPAAGTEGLQALDEAREIVPEPRRFFDLLRRVEWTAAAERWTPARVAEELHGQRQALAIVNTRRDVLRVLAASGPGVRHLSTLMCGAHRRDVLTAVRRQLDSGRECRLVATQVVEAGVDIDFPIVLRAMAPFDAIVQAGGRCNREGLLARGRVVVFDLDGGRLPAGWYTTAAGVTRSMLNAGPMDFDDPDSASRYFRQLYGLVDTDKPRVVEAQRSLAYAEVARRFRMIEDDTTPVLVPYDERARALATHLVATEPGAARALLREAQPYTVGLRQRELEEARRRGWLQDGALPIWTGPYDEVRGIGALLEAVPEEEVTL